FVGSSELQTGGTVDFGTTQVGTAVTRIVTITNVGDADLVLSPIDPSTLPAGFSLVSNLGKTTLAPGESTTFTVRLTAAAAGSPNGVIHVLSNDGDEHSFHLTLRGSVNNPPPPPPPPPPATVTKTIDDGDNGFAKTGKWHKQKEKGAFNRDVH